MQVSLYIAEHRQELEEEGGKDKAQVKSFRRVEIFLSDTSDQLCADFPGDWLGPVEGPQCN